MSWLSQLKPGSEVAIKRPTGSYSVGRVAKVNHNIGIVQLENNQRFYNGHLVLNSKVTGSVLVPVDQNVLDYIYVRDTKKRLRWWSKWLDKKSKQENLSVPEMARILKTLRTMSDIVNAERGIRNDNGSIKSDRPTEG